MQEFRDLGPHLINVTISDDRIPVYALGFGIRFSDLTDDEKESAYFSQRYLAEKYEKEVSYWRDEYQTEEKPQGGRTVSGCLYRRFARRTTGGKPCPTKTQQ